MANSSIIMSRDSCIHHKKCPVHDDKQSYHDSLQARLIEGIGDSREDPKTNTTSSSQWKQIMNLSLPLGLNLSPHNWVLE